MQWRVSNCLYKGCGFLASSALIAMDFITKLPKSNRYNSILTITNHNCSKVAIFIPCHETIMAEGVVKLFIKYMFPHYGLP